MDRRSPPIAKGAKGGAPSSTWRLLIAEGVDGIEFGGTRSRIEAGGEADKNGDAEGCEGEPPGDRGELNGIEILTRKISVGAERDGAAEGPAGDDAKNTAKEAHHAGFDEEELLDVEIGSAKGFEDADLAAAFEDGHDQSVDNAERGDGKREASEKTEQQIKDTEENLQTFRCIEQ